MEENTNEQNQEETVTMSDGLSHEASFKPAFLNGTKSADWLQQQYSAAWLFILCPLSVVQFRTVHTGG